MDGVESAKYSPRVAELLLPDPPLCDEAVLLRGWSEADVPAIVAACRDPTIARWTAMIPSPYNENDALEWITGQGPARRDGRALELAITGRQSGEIFGAVALSNVSQVQLRSGVGYWLAPQARGRGYATAAVRLVARWGFDRLGLARLELFTDVDNVDSQNVATRCGFRREGLLRSHLLVRSRGERRDSLVYGLLAEDLVEL
jgi:RimJ/RimL family protein N-acetyltransferase